MKEKHPIKSSWKGYRFDTGEYPKWNKNTVSEKIMLKNMGFPEDFHPTEEESYKLISAYLDND